MLLFLIWWLLGIFIIIAQYYIEDRIKFVFKEVGTILLWGLLGPLVVIWINVMKP